MEDKKIKKPAPKKKPAPRKKVARKKPTPKVELISYAIKMTIPTEDYANIQPEIIVKAGSIQEAHDYIAPHMNKLWKEYYLIGKRRPEPEPIPENIPVTSEKFKSAPPEVVQPITPEPVVAQVVPAPPSSSVAFTKATQAIDSCMSLDAMNLIDDQVKKSVKLTDEDKITLKPLIEIKRTKLLEDEFTKEKNGERGQKAPEQSGGGLS